VRLFIDGRRIFDYADYAGAAESDGIAGDTFGFDCYAGNRLRIADVRVYTQPLARRVSPLALGTRLVQAGQFDLAYRQFDEIRRAYPGSDLERSARFHLGVCSARAHRAQRAHDELTAFVAAFPSDELAPPALYELINLARRAGDAGEVDRLRRALAGHRGHPALQQALSDIGDEHRDLLQPRQVFYPGANEYPDDIVARVIAAHHEIARWAACFGISPLKLGFMHQSADVLLNYGAYDYLLDAYRGDDHICARTLLMMGRYDELLQRYPHLSHLRDEALIATGRYDEALANIRAEGRPATEADVVHFARGDLAALEASGGPLWDQVLIARGRIDEVLRRHPPAPEDREGQLLPYLNQRYQALLADGRYAQILDEFRNPFAQAEALIDLGRGGEAMAACPAFLQGLYLIALRAAERGDLPAARAALAIAAPSHVDERYDDTLSLACSHWLLPALIDSLDHGDIDLRAAMSDALVNHRWTSAQCLWHSAALIAGDIDERAFLAQPCQRFAQARLHFAKALRFDCLHQREQALAEYRAHLALPLDQRPLTGVVRHIVRWREQALASGRP
jgi:hypothetical protein